MLKRTFICFITHRQAITRTFHTLPPSRIAMSIDIQTTTQQGVRIAVEGCGHGTLNAIYAATEKSAKERGWDGVDLLIIGGDFQAVRNAADLNAMSVPKKYRELGDFHEYYSGVRKAPYLTIFVAGNHEAASHLWELYYGGWVCPNIYYMGAANVVRLGPLRIAGMSGIWKGYNYRKAHHERLPFNDDDVKSFYHVREIDVRKLLQLQTQVDIGISHDWPRAIEKHGNTKHLWNMKPDFERESADGSLGNQAAEYVMDRLRPPYWFSAHLHCKYSAIKTYDPPKEAVADEGETTEKVAAEETAVAQPQEQQPAAVVENPDEIDLDMDDEPAAAPQQAAPPAATSNPDEIDLDDDEATPTVPSQPAPTSATPAAVTEEDPTEALRSLLPASFSNPNPQSSYNAQPHGGNNNKTKPGQPVPPTITNTTVRFLSLDKCLPGRKFLQLAEIAPFTPSEQEQPEEPLQRPLHLSYDPEWLSITLAFHPLLRSAVGKHCPSDPNTPIPVDLGESAYRPLIEEARKWVDENITGEKLLVPEDFVQTAPPIDLANRPETGNMTDEMPVEYTNPHTAEFCRLLGVENYWDASEEEREARRVQGPRPAQERFGGRGGGGHGHGGHGHGGHGHGGHRGGGRGGGGGGWKGGRGGRGGGGRGGGGRGRGRGRGGW